MVVSALRPYFFVIQEPLESAVSRDAGEMERGSPIHTSETGSEEAQSFVRRSWRAVSGLITWIWDHIKLLFIKKIPESSQEALACSKAAFKTSVACYINVIKDPNLTVEERLRGFYDLLEVASNFLGESSAERAVCVETQVQTACNELPPWIQQELCQRLAVSDTGRLKADSYPNLLEIRKILKKVEKELPSVKLAKLHRLLSNRMTPQGRVSYLLSIIELQYKLSKRDPHVTLEGLKQYVLYLFKTFDESVKEGIYTAVRNVVLEEQSSSVEINGSLVSIQNDSLGKMIVNADPLGRRVQLGMKQWRGLICANSK